MKLWDEELEAYREEARNMLQFLPAIEDPVDEVDPIVRAQRLRNGFRDMTPIPTSEAAEATMIPGAAGDVPVRLFRPAGPIRSRIAVRRNPCARSSP
jgi:hypothetical protein